MRFSRFGIARLAPLLLLAAWPLAGAQTLSPFDVARIRSVGSVAISPDGSRIAYTLWVPRRVLDEEDGALDADRGRLPRGSTTRASSGRSPGAPTGRTWRTSPERTGTTPPRAV